MTGDDMTAAETCIAITNSGDRCSRVAKDGRFCFQHDESNETIDVPPENQGLVNWLSDELEKQAASVDGLRRDVSMNIADMREGIEDTINDIRSGDLSPETLASDLANMLPDGADRTQNTIGGGLLGAVVGLPLGPVGVAAGMSLGSTATFLLTGPDERGLMAFPVEQPPDDAEIIPSNHESIQDIREIHMLLQSLREDPDQDWLRETNTREWNMDAVADALDELPYYDHEETPPGGYYIEDVPSGMLVVFVFGEPS